jgi:hypothetical protein
MTPSITFSDFVMHGPELTTYESGGQMNYDILIGAYRESFRQANASHSMVVVDFYGVLHSGHHLTRVLFCDVGGLPCNPDSFISEKKANTQESYITFLKMKTVHLFFLRYAESHGCNYHNSSTKAALDEAFPVPKLGKHFAKLDRIWEKLNALPYPVFPQQPTVLGHYSVLLDEDFRRKYSDMIIYGNATANKEESLNVNLHDVDGERLLLSRPWRKAFQDILQENSVLELCTEMTYFL